MESADVPKRLPGMPNATFQQIASYIHTRRPTWLFIQEDNLIRIACNQFVVNWKFIEEIRATFNLKIIDIISHTTGMVITVSLDIGE